MISSPNPSSDLQTTTATTASSAFTMAYMLFLYMTQRSIKLQPVLRLQ